MKLLWNAADERFETESKYDERHVIKRAGFRWDPAVKRWWTADPVVARKFRNAADPDAELQLGETERAIESSRAEVADFDAPRPAGLEYRPFQRAGIAYALARQSTLLADEMGLGKTIQAIGVLNSVARASALPALIVCPATLKLNWQREIEKWLVHPATVGVASGSKVPRTDIVVVNYDILSRNLDALASRPWQFLIADEAHYAKTLSRVKRAWKGSGRAKALAELAERAPRKLFLTGTPIANRPKDLWPLLAMLDPEAWPVNRFFKYALRYCDAHKEGYGKFEHWNFDGISHAEELQAKLRSTLMIRRLKTEVLKELPSKSRTLVALPSTKAKLAAEKGLAETMRVALREDWAAAAEDLGGSVAKTIADLAQARHRTALRKVPEVVQFCEQALESEDKLVVFAHHRDVVDALMEGLADYAPLKIVGDTGMAARQQAVDRFQNGSAWRVMVANMKAGGTGLTLTAARTVVFAELDWTPSVVTQAEDRCHRIGQKDSVQVYHVVMDGSMDAMLAKTLVEKQEQADAALDIDAPPVSVPTPSSAKPLSAGSGSGGAGAVASGAVAPVPEAHKGLFLRVMQLLASYCDGAVSLDGRGFSKVDTEIGKGLAESAWLSEKQARLAMKLARKYHRQLPDEMREAVKKAVRESQ